MKVIIADDETDFTSVMKSVLTQKGIDVIIDPNGQLLDHLQRDLPDLIILDINLKNRDGGDLCTRLKEERHTKNIPILLISGIMDLRQICQFCGADDYLIKPFEKFELERKVMFHLEKNRVKSA